MDILFKEKNLKQFYKHFSPQNYKKFILNRNFTEFLYKKYFLLKKSRENE